MDLRPVERLLLAYVVFTTAVGLVRLPHQPAIVWVIGANILVGILMFLATRPGLGEIGQVLREVYPLVLVGALYPAIDILNSFGAISVHDAAVRAWEHRLFGGDISRTWWQTAPSVFWSTVLHGAYFAYYPVIALPVIAFLVMGRRDAARRSVLWLFATYVITYVVFVLYPVAGPYYEFPRPAPWFLDNFAARLVYGTLENGSAYGAAFPSSHVAATIVATGAAFRGSRMVGSILLVPAALLTVGVVYCQMHYAVDALAGIAVAGGVIAAGLWWENRSGIRARQQPAT